MRLAVLECNFLSPLYRKLTGKELSFVGCCVEHDLFYEQGGTEKDRKFADKILRKCIKQQGKPFTAWVVWIAVRLMGNRYWRIDNC